MATITAVSAAIYIWMITSSKQPSIGCPMFDTAMDPKLDILETMIQLTWNMQCAFMEHLSAVCRNTDRQSCPSAASLYRSLHQPGCDILFASLVFCALPCTRIARPELLLCYRFCGIYYNIVHHCAPVETCCPYVSRCVAKTT